ncbi:hypothetical protein TPHA_0B00140 [Tetrapisispora phaffii CBS 4417]|uniref:Uncharacterized protein n=1 Tax=Tetrapisispora phaffii (strain ATCC 24235 / CBS 4417 / NBRC 1672 / NRRL Y-8282 / UCD 70-5) TaxID=1071381 RepID=G8BQ89_TETPH|nr:hypothetical protein TPHA_0B00140 [Tetrapisispora phaffii CBS 4417]CCE61686.1 hypothetical protein TPHA_0B00140 [Tetrapisispora phaffii CBS 4417]
MFISIISYGPWSIKGSSTKYSKELVYGEIDDSQLSTIFYQLGINYNERSFTKRIPSAINFMLEQFRAETKVIIAIGKQNTSTLIILAPCWINSKKKNSVLNIDLEEVNRVTVSKINAMETYAPTIFPDSMEMGTLTQQNNYVTEIRNINFVTIRSLKKYYPIMYINCSKKDITLSMEHSKYCTQFFDGLMKHSPFKYVSLLRYPIQYEMKMDGVVRREKIIKFSSNEHRLGNIVLMCRNRSQNRYEIISQSENVYLKEEYIKRVGDYRYYRTIGTLTAASRPEDDDWRFEKFAQLPTYYEAMTT